LILITGANGFVGHHVVHHLISKGYTVASLIRNNVALKDSPKAIEIADNHHVIFGDLNKTPIIPFNIDAVIHLAGQIVLPGIKDEEFLSRNKAITEGLIRLLSRLDVKRVINLSTSSIYGNILCGNASEDMAPREPNAYGISKYASERELSRFSQNISVTHVRTPGIIGPSANPNLITTLTARASAGSPIELANLEADFNNVVHITDICRFLDHLLRTEPIAGCDSVNLASREPITIEQMGKLILEFYGNQCPIIIRSSPILPFVIDLRKLKKVYNFECSTVNQAIISFLKAIP
jgi:nucleoside-diphosphate-sugar epimerase